MTEVTQDQLERKISELTELADTQSQVISDQSRDNNELMSENTRLKMILWRILTGDFKAVIMPDKLMKIERSYVGLDGDKYVVMQTRDNGSVLADKRF